MKKFVFGLETLLQHRINLEDKERNKFRRIRAELQEELNHQQSLGARQTQALTELAQQKAGTCDGREIEWFYLYLNRLQQELKRSAERVAELGKHLEAQKQVMIEASRNKQMIENLKKKRRKEYLVSVDREEQKFIDEIVVNRFAFRR
jgi:flagellar FliJ protein